MTPLIFWGLQCWSPLFLKGSEFWKVSNILMGWWKFYLHFIWAVQACQSSSWSHLTGSCCAYTILVQSCYCCLPYVYCPPEQKIEVFPVFGASVLEVFSGYRFIWCGIWLLHSTLLAGDDIFLWYTLGIFGRGASVSSLSLSPSIQQTAISNFIIYFIFDKG